ncbi:uncharacterized protein LOC117121670 [Anneissia japonica]|uniref:uncharacterized protein LOC117121670 n=1 Tax=Anneissia japonica TaxID=1529436 RepID=UPI0014259A43|nr:uncharacterized protein LOC117121670 [Anneissia japonica]
MCGVRSGTVINKEKSIENKRLPQTYQRIFKRSVQQEACTTTEEWVYVRTATDMYNVNVEIQDGGMYFWKRHCTNHGTACRGFSGTSSCLNKLSWTPTNARPVGSDGSYEVHYIPIESCCACAVTI